MDQLFQTNESRVHLYLDENAGWLKIITTQAAELPVLEKMLGDKEACIESKNAEKKHFQQQLQQQQQEMSTLNNQLGEQQSRLKKDAAAKSLYDIETLCSQDILRDRIKEVEQRYVALRCSFMHFMAAII